MTLESVLKNLNQCQNSTLLLTDYRCMQHAPLLKPHVFSKMVEQRNSQPENSDRLAVLVDPDFGVFMSCSEFTEQCEGL